MKLNTSKLTILLASAFIFSLSTITRMQAAPGDLDVLFGSGGIVSFPVSFTNSGTNFGSAQAVAIQPDGKIVVAGTGYDSTNVGFGLARFNSDGSPDPTFGSAGKVVTVFPAGSAFADAVIIQPDGKIVAAGGNDPYDYGYGDDPVNFNVLLARYNADGSLDPTFGIGGKIISNVRDNTGGANDIALQSDGKIVAVGSVLVSSGSDFLLMRYNSDGSLDNSFGPGGKVTTGFNAYNEYSSAIEVAIQSDGRIIAAGSSIGYGPPNRHNFTFALARYYPDGSLDTSFGADGRVTTSTGGIESSAEATSVAIQSDGKIVTGGDSYDGLSTNATLARYNANGTLDSTFEAGGIAVTSFSHDSDSYVTDIAIQTDGRIVVAGRSIRKNFGDSTIPIGFALARYNTDGSLDLTFGAGGKIVTSFSTEHLWASYEAAAAIQPDGKIVLAGYIGPLSALFRYEGRTESISNVAVSGRVLTPGGSGLRNATVSLTDSQGEVRTVTTSSFGFYMFDNVTAGSTYTIAVSSRRYRYATQQLLVNATLTNVDFIGLE